MSSNAVFAWCRAASPCARWLPLSLLLALGGCKDEGGGDADAGHHHQHDAASEIDEDQEVPCTDDYPAYEPGMSVQAGELTITLLGVKPVPPRQKVANDWTFEITGADAAPLTSATISNADSYMEVHGHYGTRRPVVSEQAEPGQYLFDNIDFIMRGPWEILFDVQPADGAKQAVRFKICVE